jgi:hypothetical protein
MSTGRYRWLLRLAFVAVAGLALLIWYYFREPSGLVIENHSGQTISRLEVSAGGRTVTFRDVPNGKQVTATNATAGALELDGQFRDGTRIRAQFAEVPGSGLVVGPGGQITLRKARQ